MAIFVGQKVSVVTTGTDPARGNAAITDASVTVEFYEPPKNPKTTPADRTPDVSAVTMTWDDTVVNKNGSMGAYVAEVDTSGWVVGTWWYKVTFTGAYDSWGYGSFTLVP